GPSFFSFRTCPTKPDCGPLAAAPTYGDTGGAVIKVEDAIISVGDTELIRDMELAFYPQDRVALWGHNGCGKSSLLSVLSNTGSAKLDEGSVTIKAGTSLGYLVQKGVSGSTRTVYEEACSEMTEIQEAGERLAAAEAQLEKEGAEYSESALNELMDAQEHFDTVGGHEQERTVSAVLKGLGFSPADQQRSCAEFSGGWQMRIALARLLLSNAELLLLDEPTNHLDHNAKTWLTNYLRQYQGTLVLVSHDEELLEEMKLTQVVEVMNGRLEVFKGVSFRRFQVDRVERISAAKKKYELEQAEMARLQGFVDRFGAQATKASAAQSRVKMIEKMAASATPAPEANTGRSAVMKLQPPPPSHNDMLILKDATFGWGETPQVEGVNVKFERGDRIVVLGPNGAGKSTTLRALTGELPLLAGQRTVGDGVDMGVFTQDLAQDLPQDAIAVDHVLETVRVKDISISDQEARSVLGALGLTGPKALRSIGFLSGGEKARVCLAQFILGGHNLLLLDEPSNHLDGGTLEALLSALKGWKGCVVVISHNQPFVEALNPSHTALVKDGTLTYHERAPLPEDWGDAKGKGKGKGKGKAKAVEVKAAEAQAATPADAKEEARLRKKKLNAPSRIKKIEVLVEELDAKISEVDAKMLESGSDVEACMQLSKEKEELEQKSSKLYEEWEELEQYV
ncbi:unnamed protein product, partial [Chrysoparadoxa australica]